MKKFKFTDSMLLELALKQLKMTKKQFQIKQYKDLNLNKLEFLTEMETPTNKTFPDENTKLYAKEHVYASKTHLIKTTKYGRVKSIEEKPKAEPKITVLKKTIVPTTPKITIKPHRKIVK
jgi:hypothetical protein